MKKNFYLAAAFLTLIFVGLIGGNEAHAFVQTQSGGLTGRIYLKKPMNFEAGKAPEDISDEWNEYLGLMVNGKAVNTSFARVPFSGEFPYTPEKAGRYRVTFVASYKTGVFYDEGVVSITGNSTETVVTLNALSNNQGVVYVGQKLNLADFFEVRKNGVADASLTSKLKYTGEYKDGAAPGTYKGTVSVTVGNKKYTEPLTIVVEFKNQAQQEFIQKVLNESFINGDMYGKISDKANFGDFNQVLGYLGQGVIENQYVKDLLYKVVANGLAQLQEKNGDISKISNLQAEIESLLFNGKPIEGLDFNKINEMTAKIENLKKSMNGKYTEKFAELTARLQEIAAMI
ncbi:hypothetical protein DOK67_0001105 [Enterococcus sp. DIV0212c]|uniref:hypothetical protein n=1 Tax=Enterococcus sp. DIV0212c TaxID=2230867 RepID=UPI001A9BE5B8|nr:hypothetical protein [Enterococcus sp. DIV0212c]MBO1354463.1 hypothetical protein [Enterococcus sp. DIV0212c]